MIALGRRKTDTSDVVNACAAAPPRVTRQLVADLLGAPVAELDTGRVYEATCSHREHVRAAVAYETFSPKRMEAMARALGLLVIA